MTGWSLTVFYPSAAWFLLKKPKALRNRSGSGKFRVGSVWPGSTHRVGAAYSKLAGPSAAMATDKNQWGSDGGRTDEEQIREAAGGSGFSLCGFNHTENKSVFFLDSLRLIKQEGVCSQRQCDAESTWQQQARKADTWSLTCHRQLMQVNTLFLNGTDLSAKRKRLFYSNVMHQQH